MKFFQTALIFILPTFALAAVAVKRPAEGAPILFWYSKKVPNPAEKRDIPFILYERHDESNERCVKPDEPSRDLSRLWHQERRE
ncbi:hypothetical protein FPQ18DRAFT_390058 [Pyronema domesticum]|nr:hypothetical protein FPQ18DRAFT_390058 [Pyronema domesticum]